MTSNTMQKPTKHQLNLNRTTCPKCKEGELGFMDQCGDDEPCLWCANCDYTIDTNDGGPFTKELCPKYKQPILPDENGNCSLCGETKNH